MCGVDVDVKFGSGKFCSSRCAKRYSASSKKQTKKEAPVSSPVAAEVSQADKLIAQFMQIRERAKSEFNKLKDEDRANECINVLNDQILLSDIVELISNMTVGVESAIRIACSRVEKRPGISSKNISNLVSAKKKLIELLKGEENRIPIQFNVDSRDCCSYGKRARTREQEFRLRGCGHESASVSRTQQLEEMARSLAERYPVRWWYWVGV
jgi:hypothetical protein